MVLIMALAILLVLTIIGVSAVSTTNLEQRMAGNMQLKNAAFQGAESQIRWAENTPSLFTAAINSSAAQISSVSLNSHIQASASVQQAGAELPKGYSLDKFTGYLFKIKGTASTTTGNARAQTELGQGRVAPKIDS